MTPRRVVVIALTLLSACAMEVDSEIMDPRCLSAAEAYETCTGEDGTELAESCNATEDEEQLNELFGSIADMECAPVDEKALEDIGETVFVGACQVAILGLAGRQLGRNPRSQALPEATRNRLRPYIGNVVDRARIHDRALLINDFRVLGFFRVSIGKSYAGQALGNDVYIVDSLNVDSPSQLTLLAHELTHSKQAEEFGGVSGFAWHYCQRYWESGFSYENNALEVIAEDVEGSFRECTRDASKCLAPRGPF